MTETLWEAASEADIDTLRQQLDRIPRGVIGIGARCVCGRPTVVVTAPRLEDGSPFPTMFYLTHPGAVKGCSTLEAEKTMEQLNDWLAEDDQAREAYKRAHEDYISRRRRLGEVPEIDGISAGGMPTRVKCLHALVGHALAVGQGINVVGDRALELMEERNLWSPTRCTCEM
ncbi:MULTISPECIES: DUF501 domain-containing protein [unclassified Schaalia]|uniref:DUF501 domain-containing protein n=1 Tax=unclassified Schaalia TaxID=2691889 RepID=UPI001E4F8EF1|nr:DUF501 domain-containing protein [Schaalia sp. lx-260]MCD4558110.1 DUF501 domain-containing protein [Schaalia sp. lx-100]